MEWTNGVAKRYSVRRIKKMMESLNVCKCHWEDRDYHISSKMDYLMEQFEEMIEDMEESAREEKESGGDELRQPPHTYNADPGTNRKEDFKLKEALTQVYNLARKTTIINGPHTAVAHLGKLFEADIEIFSCIFVDNKNRIISCQEMSRGTVDQAPVFPREIIRKALVLNASGIILGHNHPGGDPTPSLQDRELTTKIKKICIEMGIRLLDHVIISDNGHFSFQEYGYI